MDIPLSISQVLGFTHSERINTLTVDIITQSAAVCYETEEAYQSAVLLDGYNELLQTTVEVEPILAFLEEHLAGASAEVQDTMLRGLTGFLDGNEAGLDWERIAACYAMAGQTLPEKFQ